ncbi:MAG: hypothetical protein VX581_02570 [Chloroflexota bacterium]|nr:hypothetical protein [Chloroflexota bacterium]
MVISAPRSSPKEKPNSSNTVEGSGVAIGTTVGGTVGDSVGGTVEGAFGGAFGGTVGGAFGGAAVGTKVGSGEATVAWTGAAGASAPPPQAASIETTAVATKAKASFLPLDLNIVPVRPPATIESGEPSEASA